MKKQKDEDAIALQQAVDKLKEDLTKSMTGDSEEKAAAIKADFESRLSATIAEEKTIAQNELLVF